MTFLNYLLEIGENNNVYLRGPRVLYPTNLCNNTNVPGVI